ncbi:MAG: anthranilate phosphoribosyltransferase, partial [Candidatus Sulfotelmatobacter sp.]
DATENAAIIRAILGGEKSPRRDVVLLNAAAALVAAGKADRIGEAIPLAVRSIDSGAARAKLEALTTFTSARS